MRLNAVAVARSSTAARSVRTARIARSSLPNNSHTVKVSGPYTMTYVQALLGLSCR